MCKLMIIPHVPKDKQEKAWELAIAITPYLTEKDQDGFGYMALGSKGLFGQRWLNTELAWTDTKMHKSIEAMLGGAVQDTSSDQADFGKQGEHLHSLSLHSRMATCGLGIENTHPFVNKDLSVGVVHNGVLHNPQDFGPRSSTCDSEAFLNIYQEDDVQASLNGIADFSQFLSGWYAVSALFKDKSGKWFLDVFKESRANLHAAYIKEIGAVVLVTTPQHLDNALADLNWAAATTFEFKPDTAVRIDPMTGEQVDVMPLADSTAQYMAPTSPLPYRSGWAEEYPTNDDAPAYREEEGRLAELPQALKNGYKKYGYGY